MGLGPHKIALKLFTHNNHKMLIKTIQYCAVDMFNI